MSIQGVLAGRQAWEVARKCIVCGVEVEMLAGNDAWEEATGGRWRNGEYRVALGFCCNRVYVDCLSGSFVYKSPDGGGGS